jgi:hypothetical protein
MPKRKKPVEKPETQFKRFVETAKELGVDATVVDASFDRLAKRAAGTKKSSHSSAKSR